MTQVVLIYNRGDKNAKVDYHGRNKAGQIEERGGDHFVAPLGYSNVTVHKQQMAHVSAKEDTLLTFMNIGQEPVKLDAQDRGDDGTFKSNKDADFTLQPGQAIERKIDRALSLLIVSSD